MQRFGLPQERETQIDARLDRVGGSVLCADTPACDRDGSDFCFLWLLLVLGDRVRYRTDGTPLYRVVPS
jgi:hypothetical protein